MSCRDRTEHKRYRRARRCTARLAHGKGAPVAQQTKVLLIDDLDGGDADETITFSLGGTAYEIDLSTQHAQELRTKLEKYTSKARRLGRATARASFAPRPTRSRS